MTNKKLALTLGFLALAIIAGFFWYSSSNSKTSPGSEEVRGNEFTYRIALLGLSPTIKVAFQGFKDKLNVLSGSDVSRIEYIDLDIPFSPANMENATRYIAEADVDLVVTGQSEIPLLIKTIRNIPIISVLSSNPVELGLAKSESGSGNNVVFIESGNSETTGLRLEFLLELMPQAKRILVIRGGQSLFGESDIGMAPLRQIASARNITLVEKPFSTRQELNTFFLEYDFSDIDAIFRYPGTFTASNIDLFFAFRAQIQKPIIVLNRQELERGGVLSYGARYGELGEVAAVTAWQMLKGQVEPGEVPILRPFRNELGINESVARSLGIDIPASLREKADYIIP